MSKITEFARGKPCQVRITGVCRYTSDYSVWSHARWEHSGRGKAIKAPDVAGAIACTSCDAVYDGQQKRPPGMTQAQVDADWCAGHFRSLVLLVKAGLVR